MVLFYLKFNILYVSISKDELDLPFKIVVGHLSKLYDFFFEFLLKTIKNLKMLKEILKIKIPWKSLYTESVKVLIDGLTILIAPKSSVQYDAEREKKEHLDNKLKQVKKLIDLEKSNQSKLHVRSIV
jgi:hypothetical protein